METKKTSIYKVILPIVIIFLGIVGAVSLNLLKHNLPKKKRINSVPIVKTLRLVPEPSNIIVKGFGIVSPKNSIKIYSELSGKVESVNKNFELGGIIKKEEPILQIDKRDYEVFLNVSKAELANIKLQYELEKGNQEIASREWNLLDEELKTSSKTKDLALRKPYLIAKLAELEAGESKVKKAELDLQKTKILSPFDGIILDKKVEMSSFINPQTYIATLVSVDEFYIEVKIPLNQLKFLGEIKEMKFSNNKAKIFVNTGDKESFVREGKLLRLLSDVDKEGRMLKLLVSVKDPLNLKNNLKLKPLLLGSYVQVNIEGEKLQDVFKVPLSAIKDTDTLWFLSRKNTLEYKKCEVVFSNSKDAFIKGNFKKGDRIIITHLATPLEGMKLKNE